jgi:hypothetical protein
MRGEQQGSYVRKDEGGGRRQRRGAVSRSREVRPCLPQSRAAAISVRACSRKRRAKYVISVDMHQGNVVLEFFLNPLKKRKKFKRANHRLAK